MSEENEKKPDPKLRGLGRGLDALFEDEESVYPQADQDGHTPGRSRQMISISSLMPGGGQPRTQFDEEALETLAESIKIHGVLQPLLVRPHAVREGMYEIIAGERRWRAAQKAMLHDVPAVIMNLSDSEMVEVALVENLQREDLNPLEEARGYQRLYEEFRHTQEQIAEALGKSRSHVANMMRLLSLPDAVLAALEKGDLSVGHARTLVAVDDPESLMKEILSGKLSVRETEKLAAPHSTAPKKSKPKAHPVKDADTLALEKELTDFLGMRVSIDSSDKTSGTVKISFKSLDQLDDVLRRLSDTPAAFLRE